MSLWVWGGLDLDLVRYSTLGRLESGINLSTHFNYYQQTANIWHKLLYGILIFMIEIITIRRRFWYQFYNDHWYTMVQMHASRSNQTLINWANELVNYSSLSYLFQTLKQSNILHIRSQVSRSRPIIFWDCYRKQTFFRPYNINVPFSLIFLE